MYPEAFTCLLLSVSTILLVTDRKYCDFILHAASGPDSVERIPRDEPLIQEILGNLTALWTHVIAPEIFEMRVPRDLVPFVLAEAADCLDSFESFPASPDSCLEFGDPTTCTSSASPVGSLEPDASPASPDRCFEGETPTTCTSSASLVGSVEPNAPPASVSATKSRVFVTPVSPASLSGLCETTASDLPVSVTESEQPFPADSLYTQAEINAAEALLLSVTGPASNPKSASQ